jgi:hypothetical protein
VKVVLHIKRASGSTERHELPADGDYVEVPFGLLSAEDVLGFDVEIAGPDRCGFDLEVTGRAADVHKVLD